MAGRRGRWRPGRDAAAPLGDVDLDSHADPQDHPEGTGGLRARYRRLARAGRPANVVTDAIARELAGFIWAIVRQVMAAGRLIGHAAWTQPQQEVPATHQTRSSEQTWGRGRENPRIHYLPDSPVHAGC
jgi:hypothetical protein